MVVPALIPITIPEVFTVPAAVLVLLHTPPAVISVNEVVAPPAHTAAVPIIPAGFTGNGFTVTIDVAATTPQPLVTV